jgi:hypothetical protein
MADLTAKKLNTNVLSIRPINKVLLTMQSGSLVSLSSFPKLPLAIPARNTAARSPTLDSLFTPFLVRQSRRVARLAAVSTPSDATGRRRFLVPKQNAHSCALLRTFGHRCHSNESIRQTRSCRTCLDHGRDRCISRIFRQASIQACPSEQN